MPYVTANQLDQRILSRIDNNYLLYPQPKRYAAMNEAIRILNLFTSMFQATVQLTTQPNRTWYSIQGLGLIFPSRCQFENTYLEQTSFLQLGRSKPSWVTDTSANQLTPPTSWLPFGFNTIAIHPADSLGGRSLLVTGCAEPPQLVNPTDTINLNNSYFAAFDEYASHILLLKESPKTFAQASESYKAFMRIIKEVTIYRGFIAPQYFIAESQQRLKR